MKQALTIKSAAEILSVSDRCLYRQLKLKGVNLAAKTIKKHTHVSLYKIRATLSRVKIRRWGQPSCEREGMSRFAVWKKNNAATAAAAKRRQARRRIEAARDGYVRTLISASTSVPKNEVPQPLVDAYAAYLRLKREVSKGGRKTKSV